MTSRPSSLTSSGHVRIFLAAYLFPALFWRGCAKVYGVCLGEEEAGGRQLAPTDGNHLGDELRSPHCLHTATL